MWSDSGHQSSFGATERSVNSAHHAHSLSFIGQTSQTTLALLRRLTPPRSHRHALSRVPNIRRPRSANNRKADRDSRRFSFRVILVLLLLCFAPPVNASLTRFICAAQASGLTWRDQPPRCSPPVGEVTQAGVFAVGNELITSCNHQHPRPGKGMEIPGRAQLRETSH
jgi:hypothetical protein